MRHRQNSEETDEKIKLSFIGSQVIPTYVFCPHCVCIRISFGLKVGRCAGYYLYLCSRTWRKTHMASQKAEWLLLEHLRVYEGYTHTLATPARDPFQLCFYKRCNIGHISSSHFLHLCNGDHTQSLQGTTLVSFTLVTVCKVISPVFAILPLISLKIYYCYYYIHDTVTTYI